MPLVVLYILLGVAVGAFSGLLGIGGGVVLIPALIFLFKMTQHQAQGTTMAMLVPPIGLLAAWTYYKAGHVNLVAAAALCAGFVLGSYYGAKWAVNLPGVWLHRVFGGVLIAIGIKMIFTR